MDEGITGRRPMKVEGILKSKGRSVTTVQPWVAIPEAVRMMNGPPLIGALVVCADAGQHVAGVLTERNIVRALGKYGTALLEMQVGDVMSQHVPVCSPDDSISKLMLEMTRSRHRHLPVLDNGVLSGIVSIGDVVKNRLAELELETGVLRDLYNAVR
jgi:CBS domain-containing protein